MSEVRNAYPLSWPDAYPRTKNPGGSQFKTSITKALKNVKDSVRLFGSDSDKEVTELVISSNVTLGEQRPKDSGVAVYFTWDEIETCIPVDRYAKVEDNLQAIHHCIEAERTKLRHGGIHLVRAAFQGYAKLQPPEAFDRAWYKVLEVPEYATKEMVKKAYQKLRSSTHPDHGGTVERFNEIKRAYAKAKELGKA